MNNFEDYASKAINRCNLKSYYGLAKNLGLSYAAISYFKNGKKLPSYDTMIKISKLAGIPEEKALLDLAAWANADKPEVQKIWLRIAKMISCFWLFSVFYSFDVSACISTKKAETLNTFNYPNHILCDKSVCEEEERNWRALSCYAAENKALAASNYAIDKIRTVRVKVDLR